MSIRGLIALLLLLAALGIGWQQRERLQAWAGSATFNRPQLSTDADLPKTAAAGRAGGLRKCVNGQQVSYSNVECPPGAREQEVAAGTVTVVPGTPVAKPAAAGSGPSALHRALDITRDDTLHEKIMERQIEGAR